MATLYKGEESCTALPEQVEVLKAAGWATEPPKETKKAEAKPAKTEADKE